MIGTEPRATLCQLIGMWSERWHALTEAAERVHDPIERDQLLALAEGIESCDLDARRAVRMAS